MKISIELKKRLVTGLVGAAALICLITLGGWLGIFCLATGLSLGMMFEFTGITFSMPDRIEKKYVLLSITWFIAILNALAPQAEFHLLIISFLTLFIYFLLTAKRYSEIQFPHHLRELMYSVFGLIYLVFIPFYLIRIYESLHGTEWTVLFLLIVWSGDTGAYFTGKIYGERKLYPEVSPKKTVEGAAGGLAIGIVVTLVFKMIFLSSLSWLGAILLPVLVGMVAQAGDLCESLFKRAFEKKDSGSILPGHGGFLDRFDGVVFGLPVMYACIRLFG